MYKIFEQLMERKGVSPADVSKATGISKSSLSGWKSGSYTPKADKLYALAQYFGVPMETFFGAGVGSITEKNLEPIYEVSAGQGRTNGLYPTEFMKMEDEEEDDCCWCEVHGDSMYPTLMDGDLVKVNLQTSTTPKDLTVVKINGEEATVKRVEIVKDGIWLKADNKEVFADKFYSIQDVLTLPISIIGKVVEMQRRF